MKLHVWQKRLLLLLPSILFLVLFYFSAMRGHESPWHERIVQFWNTRQWHEIIALGDNLQEIGKPNAEVLCFAMLASLQTQNPDAAGRFATRLLDTKVINPGIEKQLNRVYTPASLRQLIEAHRSKIILAILSVLILANAVSLLKKVPTSRWTATLSVIGCLLLIL